VLALKMAPVTNDAAATEMMAGIAAPLLAGAAVATTGIVVQQPTSLRWPGITLLLLVISGTLLITAVQLGFLARRHTPTPAALEESVAAAVDESPDAASVASAYDLHELLQTQLQVATTMAADLHEFWADKARWAYSFGIAILWLGLAAAVVPGTGSDQTEWRWVAAVFLALMALLEVVWLAATRLRPHWFVPARAISRRGKS
jgi:hypothetical protein